jgi:hypothetical protein
MIHHRGTEDTEDIIFDLPGDDGKSKTIGHFMAGFFKVNL